MSDELAGSDGTSEVEADGHYVAFYHPNRSEEFIFSRCLFPPRHVKGGCRKAKKFASDSDSERGERMRVSKSLTSTRSAIARY
jgi:hypothetical protein